MKIILPPSPLLNNIVFLLLKQFIIARLLVGTQIHSQATRTHTRARAEIYCDVCSFPYVPNRPPTLPKKICFGCCLTAVLTPPVHRSCLRVRWARLYMLYNSVDEEEGKNYIQKKRQRGLLLSSFFDPPKFSEDFRENFPWCVLFLLCIPRSGQKTLTVRRVRTRFWGVRDVKLYFLDSSPAFVGWWRSFRSWQRFEIEVEGKENREFFGELRQVNWGNVKI